MTKCQNAKLPKCQTAKMPSFIKDQFLLKRYFPCIIRFLEDEARNFQTITQKWSYLLCPEERRHDQLKIKLSTYVLLQQQEQERSETKVMKIENEEGPIFRWYTNFELDWSVHVRTGAENVHAWTGSHRRSHLNQQRGRTDNLKTNLTEKRKQNSAPYCSQRITQILTSPVFILN